MRANAVVVVMALLAACDECPREQIPSSAAEGSFVLAHAGRVFAGWNQMKLSARTGDFRYVTDVTSTPVAIALDTLQSAGAIGTRTAFVLEAWNGVPGPRRAALLQDDAVQIITLQAPITVASVVFDGTRYRVFYIDAQSVHMISVDEDGTLGEDRVVAPRDGFGLSYAVSDRAGGVAVLLPSDFDAAFVAFDASGVMVWRKLVRNVNGSAPVYFAGGFHLIAGTSLVAFFLDGTARSVPLPFGVTSLFSDGEVLFGISTVEVVRFSASLQTVDSINLKLPGYSISPVVAASNDHVLLFRSTSTSPRELSLVEHSASGGVVATRPLAREGKLVDGPANCRSPD